MSVFFMKRGSKPQYAPPVGTTWLYTSNGEWQCPANGTYQIEMHGGGGGAAISSMQDRIFSGASGGGSGELYTQFCEIGRIYPITIGAGGQGLRSSGTVQASNGEQTTFGDLSIDGGKGGKAIAIGSNSTAGAGTGSLATAGSVTQMQSSLGNIAGGQGNSSNTAQVYGDGGSIASTTAGAGQPGAVIITFLQPAS